MNFQTDYDFPGTSSSFDTKFFVVNLSHGSVLSSLTIAGTALKAAASSSTPATRNIVSSSNERAITCSPSGRPSRDSPAGTEIAGKPAKLIGTVNTSSRYMVSGSSIFSPIANAGVGEVGVE